MNYDYYYWKDFYTKDDIKKLHSLILNNENKTYKDIPAWSGDKILKNINEIKATQWKHFNGFFDEILDEIKVANRDNFGLQFDDPLNIDNVLLQTYYKDNEYIWHKDGSNNANYDFKFTVLINVSLDNYKGGEFQLFTNNGEMTVEEYNTPGCVIIFKSEIPHRVKKIIEGKRSTIAFFLRGLKYI